MPVSMSSTVQSGLTSLWSFDLARLQLHVRSLFNEQ